MSVLAKGTTDPRPARFCCQVHLGMKGNADSNCQVLLPGNIGKFSNNLCVVQGTEAQRFTPLRKLSRGHGKNIAGEMVAWVGGNCDRDSQPGLFGEPLQVVLPPGNRRCSRNAPQVEVIHFLFRNLVGGIQTISCAARFFFE